MYPTSIEQTSRVLIEALRQSRSSNTLDIEKVAAESRTSGPLAREIMTRFVRDPDQIALGPKTRVQLAVEVARAGGLKDAAQALTWQEFESFGAECLVEAGFRAEKNIRVKGDGRAWQIDLVGYRGDLVLAIDCKHWNTSSYESRLKSPAQHQKIATAHLLRALSKGTELQGLPVILTLLEPPTNFLEKAVLVSVEKLPSFLNAVTPYDPNLPLIFMSELIVENPMS